MPPPQASEINKNSNINICHQYKELYNPPTPSQPLYMLSNIIRLEENRLYKIPEMMYVGFLTGITLNYLLPKDSEELTTYSVALLNPLPNRLFSRKTIIFAGICAASWVTYFRR